MLLSNLIHLLQRISPGFACNNTFFVSVEQVSKFTRMAQCIFENKPSGKAAGNMQQAEHLVREVHLAEVPVVHGSWWAKHASYTEFRRQGANPVLRLDFQRAGAIDYSAMPPTHIYATSALLFALYLMEVFTSHLQAVSLIDSLLI